MRTDDLTATDDTIGGIFRYAEDEKKRVAPPITREQQLEPIEELKKWGDVLHVAMSDDQRHFELRIEAGEEQRKRGAILPSDAARIDFMERFPERRKEAGSADTRWRVAATDVSAMIIRYVWPEKQLRITEEAELVLAYLLLSIERQQHNLKRAARYHDYCVNRKVIQELAIPTPCLRESHWPVMADGSELMLHQGFAFDNARGTEDYALFMEQGTGKTLVVIARVDAEAKALRDSGEKRMYRVLVVAPKNVRMNWVNEFARYSTRPGKAAVLRGGQMGRVKGFLEAMVPSSNEEYTVVVVSYETMVNDSAMLKKIEWDLMVLDEAHYIKWHNTKRTKKALEMRDVAKSRMDLTGTPVCNSPNDLFTQLEFLRQGGSGFTTFEKFRSYYGVYKTSGHGRGASKLVDVQNMPFMRERLARMSFIVKKEEALPNLPKKTYDTIEVEMGQAQAEVYTALQKQLLFEIKNDMGDVTKSVDVNNILTRLLRLAQVTSGFVSFDAEVDLDTGDVIQPKTIEAFDPNPKMDAVIELLTDPDRDPTEKSIVWCCWVHDIKTMSKRLDDLGVRHVTYYGSTKDKERAEAERAFNHDPDCRIFIGNPGCGGTGLNLIGYPPGRESEWDTDCTLVAYYSQDWSSPKRSQSEDRAHRRGTRRPVRIVDFMVPNSIDEEIRARVTNKRETALMVQDLREVLERVLGREVTI